MKKILAATALTLLLAGCTFVKFNKTDFRKAVNGTGDDVEHPYMTGAFSSVVLNIPADVDFHVSDTCRLSISAPQNLHDIISVTCEDGVLMIGTIEGKKLGKDGVDVRLSAPVLSSVTVNGAAEIDIDSGLRTDSFDLTVNGAGDVEIDGLETKKMDVRINGAGDISTRLIGHADVGIEINGAGDITLKGSAGSVNARINGAGDIDTSDLDCTDITRNIMGLRHYKKN